MLCYIVLYACVSQCSWATGIVEITHIVRRGSHTTGPRFKTRLVRYFLPSFRLTTIIPESVERSLVCVEDRGRISRSCLTQDFKMGSCVFQCDVLHHWIALRQVGPVSVYCDRVECHVLCLPHGIPVVAAQCHCYKKVKIYPQSTKKM